MHDFLVVLNYYQCSFQLLRDGSVVTQSAPTYDLFSVFGLVIQGMADDSTLNFAIHCVPGLVV